MEHVPGTVPNNQGTGLQVAPMISSCSLHRAFIPHANARGETKLQDLENGVDEGQEGQQLRNGVEDQINAQTHEQKAPHAHHRQSFQKLGRFMGEHFLSRRGTFLHQSNTPRLRYT